MIDADYLERLASVVPASLPEGIDIFDEDASRRGLRLNKAGYSLKDGAQRELFRRDEAAWMDQFGLSDDERKLLAERDWIGLWRAGMSIYVMVKLCGVTDTPLTRVGEQMRASSTV